MRALLLGATGNLGLRCIPALVAHQHIVFLYVRDELKLSRLVSSALLSLVTVIVGDATDSLSLKKALIENEIESIIDVAGNQVWPWEEFLLPKIARAVCEAAVEVGRERGRPLRAWITSGLGILEYPGTGGNLVQDYGPSLAMNQHQATREVVEAIPLSDLQWSVICVAIMYPADSHPGEVQPLEAPRHHNLLLKATEPPEWRHTWVASIPVIGRYIDMWRVVLGQYGTYYEDVADFLAGDLEAGREEWIGKKVGMKDKGKIKET